MTDRIRSARPGATYLLQRAKSVAPTFRYKSTETKPPAKLQRQPTVVLYVDENCPTHGSQGNCTCRSVVVDQDGLGSGNSVNQNGNHGSEKNLNATNIRPFHNNPPLLHTQRDIVGNNLQFNSASEMNEWNDEQLGSLMIYRDVLKQNLTTPTLAGGGYPKMRLGRSGGSWRHITQTNSHAGSNLLYINGAVRTDDSFKYPIRRFGYPPVNRSQTFVSSSSNQDFPSSSSDITPRVFDAATWSARDELNRRPSLSQYSNRYEQHAKEGFAYWPTDSYKKPRSKAGTTGTYKTWLGLSDSILKL